MESTTFIKLLQRQGLHTNLEAAGNCRAHLFQAFSSCSLAEAVLHAGFSARQWDGRETWPLRLSLHPGPPALRGSRQLVRGCPPLSVPDTSPLQEGSAARPSDGAERAPGHHLGINETSNYTHLLQGSAASNDPHISEFPHLLPVSSQEGANYEKVTAKKDK